MHTEWGSNNAEKGEASGKLLSFRRKKDIWAGISPLTTSREQQRDGRQPVAVYLSYPSHSWHCWQHRLPSPLATWRVFDTQHMRRHLSLSVLIWSCFPDHSHVLWCVTVPHAFIKSNVALLMVWADGFAFILRTGFCAKFSCTFLLSPFSKNKNARLKHCSRKKARVAIWECISQKNIISATTKYLLSHLNKDDWCECLQKHHDKFPVLSHLSSWHFYLQVIN